MGKLDIGVDQLSLPQQRYVEVIGELLRAKGQARTTDIAERLSVSLPSVSEAVKRLAELGITTRGGDLGVGLTDAGRRAAEQLESRHASLRRFMVDVMAMDSETADSIACRVEHCVDREFSNRLLDLANFLEKEYPWTIKGIAQHARNRRAAELDTGGLSSGI